MKSNNHRFTILFTCLFSPLLATCITTGDPERTPFKADDKPNVTAYRPVAVIPVDHGNAEQGQLNQDWSRILKQKSRIQFQILHTGRVRVPRSGMLNLEHEKLKNKSDDEMFVDVFAYHFCHATQGCFLIDSGLDESFRTGKGGNVSGLLAGSYIKGSEQSEGQDIAAMLKSCAAGKKLNGVFFTHLHGDHTSGVPALPKDIRYIAGKDEAYINYFLLYYSDHLAGVKQLEEIDFTNAPTLAPLGRVVDLFGDGSFWAISTPGHSNGHVSYLLITQDGPVLLTGDASHTRWGFENEVEPGWTWNREKMRQSLRQLITFAKRYPSVRVIFGHEL